jgi:Methylase involved in ubiquinone/menaquinone biosynthesis
MLNYNWDPVWQNKKGYAAYKLRVKKAKQKLDWFAIKGSVKKSGLIIDVGCGAGYVAKELHARTGCVVIGFDISLHAIKSAKVLCSDKEAKFHVAPAAKLPLKQKSVDIVFYIGCLEHIEEFDKAIREAYRVLKPNGQICIVSSNYYSFVHFFAYKLRQKLGLWRYGYEYDWKPEELIEQLTVWSLFSSRRWGRYIVLTGNRIK